MVATGEYSSVPDAGAAIVRDHETQQPRDQETRIYAEGHALYRSMYPALKPLFPKMS